MNRQLQKAVALVLISMMFASTFATNPKREFRGAWLHIIGQGQYARMTSEQTQNYLIHQLDELKQAGCNAVIWQVRPQADAAYPSQLEPWTRYISGTAGVAPSPVWDPLQFMVDEAHKRGMELHAWINPYRVTAQKGEMPASGHIYYKHPEWFLDYADGKKYFDPGLPESRDFINKVVTDIITRYDVDAIHMDDYFYPYPVTGVDFPDTLSYQRYGNGMERGDWRRHNVDLLIELLHNTIASIKPWVRLGISPFGVWRNKKNDPRGSETNALQCYDGLYADCIKWTQMGWVDYMVPQLYWELEHKRAPALELSYWWERNANDRHMYYGLSVHNVMTHRDLNDTTNNSQLKARIAMHRDLEHVHGVTWWPGYQVVNNFNGISDSLSTRYQSTPALIPPYSWIDNEAPAAPVNVRAHLAGNVAWLNWQAPTTTDPMQQPVRFVVYRFKQGDAINLDNTDAIVDITPRTDFIVRNAQHGDTLVVTALDRCHNESDPAVATL